MRKSRVCRGSPEDCLSGSLFPGATAPLPNGASLNLHSLLVMHNRYRSYLGDALDPSFDPAFYGGFLLIDEAIDPIDGGVDLALRAS
jgi:hypothetical protein